MSRPTVEELRELVRRRKLALVAAEHVRAGQPLVEVFAAPGDVIAAKALKRLGLAASGLETIADNCAFNLVNARRQGRQDIPDDLDAVIQDLIDELWPASHG